MDYSEDTIVLLFNNISKLLDNVSLTQEQQNIVGQQLSLMIDTITAYME